MNNTNDIPERNTPSEYPPRRDGEAVPQAGRRKKNRAFVFICIAAAALFAMTACGICGAVIYKCFFESGIYSRPYPQTYLPGAYAEDSADSAVRKVNDTAAESPDLYTARELSVEEIAEKVTPSIVAVVSESGELYGKSSTGSGVILSSDGYIVTNYHVIEDGTSVRVILDNGLDYLSAVIGYDRKTDIAVLKISAPELQSAELGNSDELKQGALAVAIGNPFGLELQGTVTQGCVSAINRNVSVGSNTMTLIQTDASINPGNSGGALVNKYGQVIGINSVKLGISYYEGLGFAIPINTVKPIVEELIQYGYIKGRPALGIAGTSISARAAAFYGIPQGVLVSKVYSASDAFLKGICEGDIIIRINDTRVYSSEDISLVLNNMSADDIVTADVSRNGKILRFDIILMDEANVSF